MADQLVRDNADDQQRVLCVGMCVADIIHVVAEFPVEDSDKRSTSGRWQRGGNASNNCTVLRRLGRPATFLGPLSRAKIFEFLLDDMQQLGIQHGDCPLHDCAAPLSSVLLNTATGSRTIIHSNPGVPPLCAADFDAVDLSHYAWVHFEGRQPAETQQMMERIRRHNDATLASAEGASSSRRPITMSLDMEKTYVDYAQLLRLVDVAFVGKDLAKHWGCQSMQEAAERVWRSGLTVVCPWGETGAMLITADGGRFECPAFRWHAQVVDSLGAGDTFVAATIHRAMCLDGEESRWQQAIRFGCQIAGDKVGHVGYDCVAAMQRKLLMVD